MSDGPESFSPTHWTLVLRAQGPSTEARQALSDLCAAYYHPVVAFMQHHGPQGTDGRDLAHDFFAQLIEHDSLRPSPERGRFRSYLLGAARHFIYDHIDRNRAEKRGGGVEALPIQDIETTAPVQDRLEEVFDREWALTVLSRALDQLSVKLTESGKAHQFSVLKPWLTGELSPTAHADACTRLGMNDNALNVAIHRLRQKFRSEVKAEIARTIDDANIAGAVDDEVRYLLHILSSGR